MAFVWWFKIDVLHRPFRHGHRVKRVAMHLSEHSRFKQAIVPRTELLKVLENTIRLIGKSMDYRRLEMATTVGERENHIYCDRWIEKLPSEHNTILSRLAISRLHGVSKVWDSRCAKPPRLPK